MSALNIPEKRVLQYYLAASPSVRISQLSLDCQEKSH